MKQKTTRWVALLIVLVIVGMALAAREAIRRNLLATNMRAQVEAHLSESLGRPMRVSRVTLDLFPPSLTLHNVAPLQPNPKADFRSEQVKVDFSLLSLFSSQPVFSKIELLHPSVRLTPLALREKPFLPSSDEKKKAIIRRIEIKGGRIDYRNDGQDPQPKIPNGIQAFSLGRLDGVIQPNLAMKRFPLTLHGEAGEVSVGGLQRKIDTVDATLTLFEGGVEIKTLQASAGEQSLRVEGKVDKGNPLDLSVGLRLSMREMPEWKGKRWEGKLSVEGKLTGQPPDLRFAGDLSATSIRLDAEEIGTLTARVAYQNRRLSLSSLTGNLLSGKVLGSGEAALSDAPTLTLADYRLELAYQQLSPPQLMRLFSADATKNIDLTGVSADGTLLLTGAGQDLKTLAASGEVKAIRRRSGGSPILPDPISRTISAIREGHASWQWANGRLQIRNGVARLPGTEAAISAEWEGALSMQIDLASDEVQTLAEAWKIPATGQMTMTSRLTADKKFEGEFHFSDWALREKPLGDSGFRLVVQEKQVAIHEGALKDREAAPGADPNYRFHGRLDFSQADAPTFDFRVDVADADPQGALTFFRQSIPLTTKASGHLVVSGTPHHFSVAGPLTMPKGGTLYGTPFDAGQLHLTVTEKKVVLGQVSLKSGAQPSARLWGKGEIRYDGTYTVSARVDRLQRAQVLQSRVPGLSGEVDVKLQGEGAFRTPDLSVRLTAKKLAYDDIPIGKGEATLRLVGDTIRLKGALPKHAVQFFGETRLTDRNPFSFSGQFSTLRLDPFFRKRLPTALANFQVTATGTVEADGFLKELDRTNMVLTLSDLSGRLPGQMNDSPLHNDGPVTLHAGQGVYTFDRVRLLWEETALAVQGSLVPFEFWNLFLEGEADLNLLAGLTNKIDSARGTATLNLHIFDEWRQPKIEGTLSLSQGIIRAAAFSDSIYLAKLSAVFNNRVVVLEQFDGRLGGGPFHLEGHADLTGFRPSRFGLQGDLSNVGIHLLPDLPVVLDGVLLLTGDLEKQRLSGEVVVKEMMIRRRIDLKTLVAELGRPKEAKRASALDRVDLNLSVRGKENVGIDNNVAKVPLVLDLVMKGTLAEPIPLGRIEIPRGHLYFQNNDFKVTSGSVEFLNLAKIEPTFDLRAETRLRNFSGVEASESDTTPPDYTLQLSLIGTPSQFTFDLVSSPPLPERELQALLSGEATSLVFSEFLEAPIQKLTGVDRIRVSPESSGKSSNATRITAEKRFLDDRFSVLYSTTTDASEEPQIRLIYEFSPHLSLVGEQDEKGRKGGDLRFQFHLR